MMFQMFLAGKALIINRIDDDDNDFDVYIFTYWDNFKDSKAQEALDYIEKSLKQNFKNFNVNDSNQIYKVDEIEH
jgi:hypothetical protein